MHLDLDIVRGVLTVVWFLLFLALWITAWSRKRREEFAAAARLPLEATADRLENEEHV